MKTKLIALVTATAIAFTGLTTAPARADNASSELLRFMVGAAVLGAFVNSANNNNNNNRHVTVTNNQRKHNGHRHHNRAKPKQCLRKKYTNRGWVTYYANRCMAKFGWHFHGRKWHTHRHAHR